MKEVRVVPDDYLSGTLTDNNGLTMFNSYPTKGNNKRPPVPFELRVVAGASLAGLMLTALGIPVYFWWQRHRKNDRGSE